MHVLCMWRFEFFFFIRFLVVSNRINCNNNLGHFNFNTQITLSNAKWHRERFMAAVLSDGGKGFWKTGGILRNCWIHIRI